MSRSRYLALPWRSACCRAGGWPMRSPNEYAHDDAMAGRLADVSRELVGLRA